MKQINIILYEPEIAQNTASIMRTAAATGAKIHLIEPLGFILDHRNFARASANNWENAEYELYDNWDAFTKKNNHVLYCATRYGKKPLSDFKLSNLNEIWLLFGKESIGIPLEILKQNQDNCFRIPMKSNARSLNISNAVGISVYEVLRQWDYQNLSKVEVQKGEDYINEH